MLVKYALASLLLLSYNAFSTEYLCVSEDGTEIQISTFLTTITTPDGKYKYKGKTDDERHYLFKGDGDYYLVRKHPEVEKAIIYAKHDSEVLIDRGICYDN